MCVIIYNITGIYHLSGREYLAVICIL